MGTGTCEGGKGGVKGRGGHGGVNYVLFVFLCPSLSPEVEFRSV